jgi:hypothetical protein
VHALQSDAVWLALPRTAVEPHSPQCKTVAGIRMEHVEYMWEVTRDLFLSSVMSSPLAWQGDGPPQTLPVSSSPQCAAQFDAPHSLAALTFIASQLSTLLYSVALASSAASSPSSSPRPTAPAAPLPHSPSPIAPPLSNSLALCHSNLTSALSNVLSTSFQLIVLSTSVPSLTSHTTPPFTPLPLPTSFAASSSLLTPVSVPPRFTIRVVTDLEPVTPTRSRSPSPAPSLPCSPTLSPTTPPTVTAPSDAPAAEQSAVAEKATLHLVSAAATVSACQTPLTDSSDSNQHSTASSSLPSPLPTSTQPVTPTIDSSFPSFPVHPVTRTVDATGSVDEIDVAAKAISHLVSAATASPPVDSAQPVNGNGDDQHSTHISISRPSTRSTDTPIHPFFVDLSNRTGKAAKHFRRLYPATPTICECGLFPAFATQRLSSAPAFTLPGPFQRLCLSCLETLHIDWAQHSADYQCLDIYQEVVSPQFWCDEWHSTLGAHYDGYYTRAQHNALQLQCLTTTTGWDGACEWITSSLRAALGKRGRKLKKCGKQGTGRQ